MDIERIRTFELSDRDVALLLVGIALGGAAFALGAHLILHLI